MKKPHREHLSFMIYDIGLDEAIEHFQLTSDEAELILFGVAEKLPAKPHQYRERKQQERPSLMSPDVVQLRRVIADSYDRLHKETYADISKTVNSRGMSPFDTFHDGLVNILEFNPDYQFISDEQTLAYVRARLKRSAHAAEERARVFPVSVALRADMHLRSMELECESPVHRLTANMRKVIERKIEGKNNQEIASEFHVNEKTVRRWLKRIKVEIRKNK